MLGHMLAREIFFHSLFSRRSTALIRIISWICILGVGIGVAALIIVLSVMNGFDEAIRHRLLSVEPHLIVQNTGEPALLVDLISKTVPAAHLISRFVSQDVIVRTKEGFFSGALSKGLETNAIGNIVEASLRLRNQENQRNFGKKAIERIETSQVKLLENEILLGVDLARNLEVFEGDEVVVISPEALLLPEGSVPKYEKLRIKGLLRTNVPELDSGGFIYQLGSSLKRLSKDSGRTEGVEIFLKNPYAIGEVRENLTRAGLKVETWEDRNKSLFYSLRMEKMAMGIFLSLSVLIASFSIFTVLVLLVTHKRSEVGVLRALGLSLRQAQNTLTVVGLLLSSLGLWGGLVVGLLGCWAIETFPVFSLPDIYYDTRIPVRVDLWVVGGVFVSCTLAAALSSWLPARFIARGNPSELLRQQG